MAHIHSQLAKHIAAGIVEDIHAAAALKPLMAIWPGVSSQSGSRSKRTKPHPKSAKAHTQSAIRRILLKSTGNIR